MNKDLNKLMRSYQFKLVRTSKHYKWEGPNRAVVFTSKTASDRRSLKNIKSNIIKQLNHVS